jgi:GNAT superfamily N-acetyltransferase
VSYVSVATNAPDDNLVVHATYAARHRPDARIVVGKDLVLVDSGLPSDTFNFICRSRLHTATAETRIGEALAFFQRSAHPFSWWLTPGHSPRHLPQLLEQAGLEPAESEWAMALPLSDLRPRIVPAGLEIRRVQSAGDLAMFAEVTAAHWTPPDRHVITFYAGAEALLLDPDSPQWLYLGLMDGEPVATAELTVGGGVVGLYNISTRPEYRDRGIGSAMTGTPLLEAREAGHTMAILQAAPAGIRIYERLGFRHFGGITEYKPVTQGGTAPAA